MPFVDVTKLVRPLRFMLLLQPQTSSPQRCTIAPLQLLSTYGIADDDKQVVKYARSSGAGGQHVNTTESKVDMRIHLDHIQLPPEVSAASSCTLPLSSLLNFLPMRKREPITVPGCSLWLGGYDPRPYLMFGGPRSPSVSSQGSQTSD